MRAKSFLSHAMNVGAKNTAKPNSTQNPLFTGKVLRKIIEGQYGARDKSIYNYHQCLVVC